MSAAKYIKALKEVASYENLKTQQMTAFEQRAITKLLYAVIKNAPYKSYFKSLVCYEELGGITDIDNSFLANSINTTPVKEAKHQLSGIISSRESFLKIARG